MSVEREIEALVRRVVREELARLAPQSNGAPWLTTEEAADLVGTSPAAIRHRLHSGWLKGSTVNDGRRVLIKREALLTELERRRR